MSKWETVKLGEVCKKITDGSHNPPSGVEQSQYLMLSSKNVENGRITLVEPRYLSKEDFIFENKRTEIEADDILLTIVGTIGRVALVPKELKYLTLQRSVAVLKPEKKHIISKYLMYVLQSMEKGLNQEARGVAQKGIYLSQVNKLEIPLPPLEEQKRIADILDKASKLIDLRKQQLEKMDLLIKSKFVDIFGDTVTNPKGWEKCEWKKVFNTATGKLDSNAMNENGKYPFFTCSKEVHFIDTYAFDQEALLLAGNNATANYDVKYYSGKFNAYQRTYILTLKECNNQYCFFKFLLEQKLQHLQQQSKGSNTKYLTMGILDKLDFILPPTFLQNQFAAFVEQVEKQKAVMQQSLEKMEMNYKALMKEYFG